MVIVVSYIYIKYYAGDLEPHHASDQLYNVMYGIVLFTLYHIYSIATV